LPCRLIFACRVRALLRGEAAGGFLVQGDRLVDPSVVAQQIGGGDERVYGRAMRRAGEARSRHAIDLVRAELRTRLQAGDREPRTTVLRSTLHAAHEELQGIGVLACPEQKAGQLELDGRPAGRGPAAAEFVNGSVRHAADVAAPDEQPPEHLPCPEQGAPGQRR
jgi:hypothetical protein